MKNTLMSILIALLTVNFIFCQENKTQKSSVPANELNFFYSIEGVWEGIPQDTSFVSLLKYKKSTKGYFIYVNNDLFTKKRKPFSHYEGTYYFNPNKTRIEFTTINKSVIHTGYCKVRSDTLYHFAKITGKSGNVKAYTSAIVKVDDKKFAYYATYSKNGEIPNLVFEHPLIYRKLED